MTDPLAGRRILLTRTPGRAEALAGRLRHAGAITTAAPPIRIAEPADPATLDRAVLALAAADYDWVVFTSVNAVGAVLGRSVTLRLDPPVPATTRVAAVGPATAATLHGRGLPVDLLPLHGGGAAELLACWPSAPAAGGREVLMPVSDIGGHELLRGLTAVGYRVDRVDAYRTVPEPLPEAVSVDLAAGNFDAVLVYSPSAARSLGSVGTGGDPVIGAIGAPTAAALRDAGLTPTFVAADPTDDAMIAGLLDALGARTTPAAEGGS